VKQYIIWPSVWHIWVLLTICTGIGCASEWWQYYQYACLVQELRSLHSVYQVLSTCVCNDGCDEDQQEDVPFTLVNRDSQYLTQQANAFVQKALPERFRTQTRRNQTRRPSQPAPKRTTSRSLQGRSSRGSLEIPLTRGTFWISSLFGPRKQSSGKSGFHYGVDFAAVRGTPVYAAGSGHVVQAGWQGGYGNVIVIDHGDGMRTRYAHLATIAVRARQYVTTGAYIGKVGDTGNVRRYGHDGSHLHFEVEQYGRRKNPFYFLRVE